MNKVPTIFGGEGWLQMRNWAILLLCIMIECFLGRYLAFHLVLGDQRFPGGSDIKLTSLTDVGINSFFRLILY